MANLHSNLFSLSAKRGNRLAFRLQKEAGGYRSVSNREYRDKALRLGSFLQEKGIGRGDRVLISSENAPEWTMAALAVMNAGATLVPVASMSSALEVRNILQNAKPKFCFLSTRCTAARQLEKDLAEAGKPESFFWDLQSREPLERLIADRKPVPVNEDIAGDEIAMLIYTSGTTGSPKAVPISHNNILTNARDALAVLQPSERDRIVSVLPLSHMFEFTAGFVVTTIAGAPVTYTKSLRPEDLLSALRDTKATILVAVPLLYEVIARNLQARLQELPNPLRSYFRAARKVTSAQPALGKLLFFPIHKVLGGHIRFFMAGGSKLHPQTFEFYRSIGIKLMQGYGLTETSPVLTVTSEENAAPDHIGKALPSVELGIFNDQGERLGPGVEGEIWAKGPSVFKGYLDQEHNQGVFSEGWFRTGDLGTVDEEGFFRITGRKKDIIVTSAGKNVYPEEIEGVVASTGKFLEVCVLGLSDEEGNEKVCLVIVPDKTKFPDKSKAELIKAATALASEATRTLSDYKQPQRIEVLFEELPKTSTRKIKKHEVRKILLAKAAAGESKEQKTQSANGLKLDDHLERTLAEALASVTKTEVGTASRTDSLTKDLGIDSLTFVELVSATEKKLNTRVEGVEFASVNTVEDLLNAFRANIGARRKQSLFSRVFFTDFPAENNLRLRWKLPRRLLNMWLRAYLKIRHELEVEGLENIQGNSPYIFTPNHASHFDMLAIIGSLPGSRIHNTFAVAAKDYFFNRSWVALFGRILFNAIPFDRRGRVEESMAKCKDVLDQGGSLSLFPEGTRSPDGTLQKFKCGVGQLLAGHLHAKAVPVYIEGAYQIMPKGHHLPGPGKLKIVYGKPISFADLPRTPESYEKIASRLHDEVANLAALKS